MGKKNKQQSSRNFHKKKHATAVAFDQNQRDQFLKGMFGAKRRRRADKKKYAEQKIAEGKKIEKAEIRKNRKEQLEKTKQLLLDIRSNQQEMYGGIEKKQAKEEPKLLVKKEEQVVIETKFY